MLRTMVKNQMEICMYERVQNTYCAIKLEVPANHYFNGKEDEMITSKINSNSAGPGNLRKSFG